MAFAAKETQRKSKRDEGGGTNASGKMIPCQESHLADKERHSFVAHCTSPPPDVQVEWFRVSSGKTVGKPSGWATHGPIGKPDDDDVEG